MRKKHLPLTAAALLAVGGLWFAGSAWRTHRVKESGAGNGLEIAPDPTTSGPDQALHESNTAVGLETPPGTPLRRPALRPPEPNRRFSDFTPEQRVEFARRGHGPGG